MKIGPYTIEKKDDRNTIVTKRVQRTANRDTKNHKKGDKYWDDSFIGYYKNLELALLAVYDNAVPTLLSQDYCEVDDVLWKLDENKDEIIKAIDTKPKERYNKVRMLTTEGFDHLQKEIMRTGKTFDMVVDEL